MCSFAAHHQNANGGAGAGKKLNQGCQQAAEAGASKLKDGEEGLAAAIAAVLVMENDERFNAGTGAALGLDGVTIETDIGQVMHKETHCDHELRRFMNHDLGKYHVSVKTDIHDIDVIFVQEMTV